MGCTASCSADRAAHNASRGRGGPPTEYTRINASDLTLYRVPRWCWTWITRRWGCQVPRYGTSLKTSLQQTLARCDTAHVNTISLSSTMRSSIVHSAITCGRCQVLGIDASAVSVNQLQQGSICVGFEILQDFRTPRQLRDKLVGAANDPASGLYDGVLTSKMDRARSTAALDKILAAEVLCCCDSLLHVV